MTPIYGTALAEGIEFHVQSDDPVAVASLFTWLRRSPVAARRLTAVDQADWERKHERPFDEVQECLRTIASAHAIAAEARQRYAEISDIAFAASKRRDLEERQRAGAEMRRHRSRALSAEALNVRLTRHLEFLMRATYAKRHRPGQAPEPALFKSRSLHADGDFARRSRADEIGEANAAAVDILGSIPGASPEVCQAYSILDGMRWNHEAAPPDDVEILQEQVDWLCELVDMAYRGSFDLHDPDSTPVEAITDRKLPRSVCVAEIRAAISRKPPPLLDERVALIKRPGGR